MSARITVSHLGKAYKQYPSKWARLAEWLLPFWGPRHHAHWVLHDLSFEVQPGEALGIVGVNGAGKSTLLKMLAGTSAPSAGEIQLSGRIASLLELGIGFHPDFTGRENVYLTGQLQQLSDAEITRLMPAIEEFAGIGHYLDEPLRIYSSGMQVRLAFSIATAIRPDVLIVDEALSVGDAEFQHRSYERISEFRKLGTSILFVSHDKGVIMSLCDRAILLEGGTIALEGLPEAVMDYYNAKLAPQVHQEITQIDDAFGGIQTQSGSGEVSLQSVQLVNTNHQAIDVITVGEEVIIEVTTQCQVPIPSLVAGFMIKDRLGNVLFGTNTYHLQAQLHDLPQGAVQRFAFTIPMNIAPGHYSVSIALHADDTHLQTNYCWRDRAFFFTVAKGPEPIFVGSTQLPCRVRIDRAA